MKSFVILTARDQALLKALALRVRLFSLRQVAAHWFGGDVSNARRRLRQLEALGLVQSVKVNARPTPRLIAPVIQWHPGDPAPRFGHVAETLTKRWLNRPTRICRAFLATSKTANLFGGKARGELKRPLQATHDLGVAAVWMVLDAHSPERADRWRSEDLLAHTRNKPGDKLPDAFIVNESDNVIEVIEFGGAYDAARVRDFHQDCEHRRTPYELW